MYFNEDERKAYNDHPTPIVVKRTRMRPYYKWYEQMFLLKTMRWDGSLGAHRRICVCSESPMTTEQLTQILREKYGLDISNMSRNQLFDNELWKEVIRATKDSYQVARILSREDDEIVENTK